MAHVDCGADLVIFTKRVVKKSNVPTGLGLRHLGAELRTKGFFSKDYGYASDYDFVSDHEGCCFRLVQGSDTMVFIATPATTTATATAQQPTPTRPASYSQSQNPQRSNNITNHYVEPQRHSSVPTPSTPNLLDALFGQLGISPQQPRPSAQQQQVPAPNRSTYQRPPPPPQYSAPQPSQQPRSAPTASSNERNPLATQELIARSIEELEELVEIALDPTVNLDGVLLPHLESHLTRSLSVLQRNSYRSLLEFLQERPGLARITIKQNKSYITPGPTAGDSDVTCAMCLCPGRFARFISPCAHRFHVVCIRSWIQKEPSCPSCRQAIPARMIPR